MLFAYRGKDGRLERLEPDAPLSEAIWIDLCQPDAEEAAAVHAALGVEVPTLADMEEIEISNRFYHVGEIDYMTVVLPGAQPDSTQVMPQHIRPHAFIPAAGALTDTSIDELIWSGLHLAFPLPSMDEPSEATFRRLLDALAQRNGPIGRSH